MRHERAFHEASKRELGRLSRSLLAAKAFSSAEELEGVAEREPWRVQVNDGGDVAVLGMWRSHLPVLAIDALWCSARNIPEAVRQIRDVGRQHGLTDVVSPPVPVEEEAPYLLAGMHTYTTVLTLVRTTTEEESAPDPDCLVIRPAGSPDVDLLLDLDARCFEPFWHYDAQHVVRFCTTARLAVAERDGEAVGYTLCTVDGGEGLIGRLCVVPEWRRRGIGRALLLDAVRHSTRHGARRITLSTQVENQTSQALYRGTAFRDTGRRFAFMRFGESEE
jgi:ribosomal-protein-alanine N-acetyltransferase